LYARVFASVVLSLSFAMGPALTSAPAHADEVSQNKARVARLQGLVEQTARKLEAGTRVYQRDLAALQRVQARYKSTAAKVAAKEQLAAEGRERVAALARRMYMQPVDDQLRMAVGMDADQVLGLIRTQSELTQVAVSDTELVRRAERARLDLERTKATVWQLAKQTTALAARSERQVQELRALAMQVSEQLSAAQGDLASARAREFARIKAAKARAARLRALLLARSSRGAGCKDGSTEGMANGNLDPVVLCTVWGAPGHRLRTDAAHAFTRMSKLHAKHTGEPLCITDSYRSYAEQVDVYQRKPELAAVPGTSNHGWGVATDLCGGVQTAGTKAFRWMKKYGPSFGWVHPAWAEPSGSKPEAWHWEFTG
jgi:hypothetical protein